MHNLIQLLVIGILLVVAESETDIEYPVENQPKECILSTGQEGICRLISNCPSILPTIAVNRPILCGWEDKIPIVCCPHADRLEDVCPAVVNEIEEVEVSTTFQAENISLEARSGFGAVGGIDAVELSFPWMAAIAEKGSEPALSRFFCGGSLINRRYVLTAAHCFNLKDLDPSIYEVLYGSVILSNTLAISIEKIILHSDFKQPPLYNDIALVKLEIEVSLADNIMPICLPTPEINSLSEVSPLNATITGWGLLQFGGEASEKMQQVKFPLVSNKKCNATFLNIRGMLRHYPKGISGGLICAGHDVEKKDACNGDSGGPLFITDPSSTRWVLIGIVSSGYQCAVPGIPGIYTRVFEFIPWILQNME